jgi:hypothetical protein
MVPVERPQVDCIDGLAGGASDPQKPIPRGDSSADCRREQHWRPEGLALVPGSNQAVGILKHLSVGRTPVRRFLFRGLTALIL